MTAGLDDPNPQTSELCPLACVQGEGITCGLKKVTADMKSKNRTDEPALASCGPTATRDRASSSAGGSKAGGPARVELEGDRKWVVEYQVGGGRRGGSSRWGGGGGGAVAGGGGKGGSVVVCVCECR